MSLATMPKPTPPIETPSACEEVTPPRRDGWRRRLIPVGLVLAAVLAVALVAVMPEEAPPEPPRDVPPVNVQILPIQAIDELADTIDLTAVVEPDRVVKVAAEVPGRIERYAQRQGEISRGGRLLPKGGMLEEGEPIRQGDPILHLNPDLLQVAYQRAKAQFDYDEGEYQRVLALSQSGAASTTELEDKRTKRDVSKAMMAEAAEALKRTTVIAPIDGILNALTMEIGEYAQTGDSIAEIVDIAFAKVVVDVPERDVHYLKLGDTATIFVRAPVENQRTGQITYISELSDEATRTTRVEIRVDNRDHTLRSGQIVRSRLTRRVLHAVVMIPLAAVIPLEDGQAVYVVDEANRADRRDVELGMIRGRSVRILSGLDAGDRLIVVGHRYVGPGQPVVIVQGE